MILIYFAASGVLTDGVHEDKVFVKPLIHSYFFK